MTNKTIGILALQGNFSEHADMLSKLSINTVFVREPKDLETIDALIIPGGESTSMLKLLDFTGLREPLGEFLRKKPVIGTCAGLILLAKTVHPEQFSYGVLNVEVERNAYGSQLDSFNEQVVLQDGAKVAGVFIRAPKITRILSENVTVLATFHGEPVAIQEGNVIGLTFHPELTEDTWFHERLVEIL